MKKVILGGALVAVLAVTGVASAQAWGGHHVDDNGDFYDHEHGYGVYNVYHQYDDVALEQEEAIAEEDLTGYHVSNPHHTEVVQGTHNPDCVYSDEHHSESIDYHYGYHGGNNANGGYGHYGHNGGHHRHHNR